MRFEQSKQKLLKFIKWFDGRNGLIILYLISTIFVVFFVPRSIEHVFTLFTGILLGSAWTVIIIFIMEKKR